MDRHEFVNRTVDLLKERDARKPVRKMQMKLYVSNEDGDRKPFTVTKDATALLFTRDDVAKILEAMEDVMADSLANGEEVNFFGFGGIGLSYHKPKEVTHPLTKEKYMSEGKFYPRLTVGQKMKRSANIFAAKYKESIQKRSDVDDAILRAHTQDTIWADDREDGGMNGED